MAPKSISSSLRAQRTNYGKGLGDCPIHVSQVFAENTPSLQRELVSSVNFLKWDVVAVLIFYMYSIRRFALFMSQLCIFPWLLAPKCKLVALKY